MERQGQTESRPPEPMGGSESQQIGRRSLLGIGTALGVSYVAGGLGQGAARGQEQEVEAHEPTVNHLGVKHGRELADKAFAKSEDARAISKAMLDHGLTSTPERAHLFSLYSPESGVSLAISVIPFGRKDHKMAGGLSVSQGGFAKGVAVDIAENQVTGFTTFDAVKGKVVTSHHDAKALTSRGAQALQEEAGKVVAGQHLIEITRPQVHSISQTAFNSLIHDDFAKKEYSQQEIRGLAANTKIISEISTFVLLRTSGSACCSCSCSCWGSSSCSCSAG
jgi:hypothetical protein